MPLNRIYQGRIANVELLNNSHDKKEHAEKLWLPFDSDPKLAREKWQAALWRHHEVFQDAVNYYTLALAGMTMGAVGDSPEAKALRSWAEKVRETWSTARRKADIFPGPRQRLAQLPGFHAAAASFDAALQKILSQSKATNELRAAALLQLLREVDGGDMNVICVSRLPWLASPSGKCDATSRATASDQEVRRQQFVRQLHAVSRTETLRHAPSLDLGLFLTKPPTEQVTGEDAAKMLCGYWKKASGKHPVIKEVSESFEQFLESSGGTLSIPSPGRKPSGLYPVCAIFKYFPCDQTLAAFLDATRTLAEAKDKELVEDAIAAARIDDSPHFDYFSNIALSYPEADNLDEDKGRDTRAVWFEFDLAAFIEAIKAPHRYFQDTVSREAVAANIRAKLGMMEAQGGSNPDAQTDASDDDEGGHPSLPGFAGDKRIALIREIVGEKLCWLAEAEGDDSEAETAGGVVKKEYTIRERTIRGLADIKRRWRAAAETGNPTEARLLEILASEQTAHRDDFGAATFYRELAKPEYHPIWRDSGTQPWHAQDPLKAWLDYKELQFELADKTRPIRFTPAHAEYSPRYFIFPKENEAAPKPTGKKLPRPGLKSRHQPGTLAFTAGIIVENENQRLAPSIVRVHYNAPRLCRDHTRAPGDTDLHQAPWIQPMMAALGGDAGGVGEKVNFANCRITLQPSGRDNIQLTFPVSIETGQIKTRLGKEALWGKQFNLHPEGSSFHEASLRWPHEKQPSKPPESWQTQVDSLHVLATDLGQRDAGAFARILASRNKFPESRPSRKIGEDSSSVWCATVERTGMFRLPGEDARVWREKSPLDTNNKNDPGESFAMREEPWGERGRPARDWEADETVELMRLLEVPADDPARTLLDANWRNALSHPEQNDKLLVAARRYQSRISRLHRWCHFLRGDDQRHKTARTEIGECEDICLASQNFREQFATNNPHALAQLDEELRARLHTAQKILVRLANRILPLRGRSWAWEKHPGATSANSLHHLTQNGPSLDTSERPVWIRGQRGLSMERIEQIEELRKRFQSLNQTLRRPIGGKPPLRRDESVPDPCPDLLEKLDRMKEQRVNQTAHFILAEALGLRLASPPADKRNLSQKQDRHGTYEKIIHTGKWITPVDFVVIEDLSRYNASQGRAPRENGRLMKWCHRAVRDKLKQLCEVFGLPVVETPAAYSSRFCARTGMPGFRAIEIAPGFENTAPWRWLKDKKDDNGQPATEAAHIAELIRQLAEAQKLPTRTGKPPQAPRTLFAPIAGGPVFIPICANATASDHPKLKPAIVQADINAAINLALRAIADPCLWAIHPRLRTQHAAASGQKKKTPTGAIPESAPKVAPVRSTREKRKYGEKGKLIQINYPETAKIDASHQPNFFADLAALRPLAEQLAQRSPRDHSWLLKEWTTATITGDDTAAPPLIDGKSFWGTIKAAQWVRIREINDVRITTWRNNDNIPM